MKTVEEIEKALIESGLDTEKARSLADKIAPKPPAPTEAELQTKRRELVQARLAELAAPAPLGSPAHDRIDRAIERERLVRELLATRGAA
jgi:hypothetical protein